jgi:hypothetical protein
MNSLYFVHNVCGFGMNVLQEHDATNGKHSSQ